MMKICESEDKWDDETIRAHQNKMLIVSFYEFHLCLTTFIQLYSGSQEITIHRTLALNIDRDGTQAGIS